MATAQVTPNKEGKKIYFPQQKKLLAKEIFSISAIQYPRYDVLWKKLIRFVSVIAVFSCKS